MAKAKKKVKEEVVKAVAEAVTEQPVLKVVVKEEEKPAPGVVGNLLAKMQQLIAELDSRAVRFDRGVKAEGTRIRKSMQDLKSFAQMVRSAVVEIKASIPIDPKKSAKAKKRTVFGKK